MYPSINHYWQEAERALFGIIKPRHIKKKLLKSTEARFLSIASLVQSRVLGLHLGSFYRQLIGLEGTNGTESPTKELQNILLFFRKYHVFKL